MMLGSGRSAGLSISMTSPLRSDDLVLDARRRGEDVEFVFAFQPLLHDVHVEQAQEADAKAEIERLRGFRLVDQRGVVELELFQRVAQLAVVVVFDRVHPGEDHRLDLLVAGQAVPPRR